MPALAAQPSRVYPTPPPLEVDELVSMADLVRLRPEWDRLFEDGARATPFQAPEWLLPWLAHFGADGLWTLVARRGGRLVGVAPLRVEDRPDGRVVTFAGRGITDYTGFLVAPGAAGDGAVDA